MTIYVSRELSDFIEETPIIDLVFICFSLIILLGAGFALYFVLVSKILPDLLLSPAPKGRTRDRGIKKYTFEDGRGVVYEPQLGFRKYVKKYLLFSYKQKKYIKLKLSEGVRTAVCELALYDNRDRQIKLMSFFVTVGKNGESESILLPDDSSYASLSVVAVNGIGVSEKDTATGFSTIRLSVFFTVTTILTVAVGMVIRFIMVFAGDLFFKYSASVDSDGYVFALILSLAVGILISLLAANEYSNKNRFKVKR